MAKKVTIEPFFANPAMEIQLDIDLKKLTDFAFEMQNKDKKGVHHTNRGGWQSGDISKDKHEEFIKLKKEITQYLQMYHSEIFQGMKFKTDVTQTLANMWVNINEKHHYNEWHIHPNATLSGVYYIKHDGSDENGNILFKHPTSSYITSSHWPNGIVEKHNEISSPGISVTPKSNILLIFPSWLEHRVETNLKDDARISVSFNSSPILEKKS